MRPYSLSPSCEYEIQHGWPHKTAYRNRRDGSDGFIQDTYIILHFAVTPSVCSRILYTYESALITRDVCTLRPKQRIRPSFTSSSIPNWTRTQYATSFRPTLGEILSVPCVPGLAYLTLRYTLARTSYPCLPLPSFAVDPISP